MNPHKIIFDSLDWTNAGIGLRYKAFVHGNQRLRLVEYSEGFVEKEGCIRGHAAVVLNGSFAIEFQDNTESYSQGDIIFIPSGEVDRHKALVGKGEKVTLLLFEMLE